MLEKEAQSPLPVGVAAPDFALRSTPDQTVSLSEFRGRPVVLVFYPSDWDPVSTDQMTLYQAVLPDVERLGGQLIGISADSVWSHLAFGLNQGLSFPLLTDFAPRGGVARAYGVYCPERATSERALFVVGPAGFICWNSVVPESVNPGADGFMKVLEVLQSKARGG